MMVVSPNTTAKSMLKSKRSNDDRPNFLSTLLTAIQRSPTKVDLVFSIFGLLSNVALDAKGSTILRSLGANALAVEAIRDHPDSPELHSVAFALLRNVLNVHENEQQHTLDLVQLVLQSMEKHTEDEMLQINGCQLLLEVVVSSQTSQLRASVQTLVLGVAMVKIL